MIEYKFPAYLRRHGGRWWWIRDCMSLVQLLLVCAMKTHVHCPGFSVHPLLAIQQDFGAYTPSFRHTLGIGSKIVPPRRLFNSKCVQAIASLKFICGERLTLPAVWRLTASLRGIQGCFNLKDLNAKSIWIGFRVSWFSFIFSWHLLLLFLAQASLSLWRVNRLCSAI